MQLYYYQVYCNQLINHQLNNFTVSAFFLILISGIFTSVNPCNIAMLPIATSYINQSKLSFLQQFVLVGGMLTSFLAMIIVTILFNVYYQQFSRTMPSISSVYIIIIGLSLLDIFDCSWVLMTLDRLKHFTQNRYLIIKEYMTGVLLGLNSLSCSTPILVSLMYWIVKSKFILLGLIYIFSYIFGYMIPLFVFIQLASNYQNLIYRNKFYVYINPFLGSLIVTTGIFLFFNSIFI